MSVRAPGSAKLRPPGPDGIRRAPPGTPASGKPALRAAFVCRAPHWIKPVLLGAGLALALLVPGCVYLPQGALPDPATLTPEQRADQNELVYSTAWDLVQRGYFSNRYKGIDWDAAYDRHLAAARAATNDTELYNAINDLIDELDDDHTHALSPAEADEMDREQRVLLGLILRPADADKPDGPMLIFDTIPGSNAAESGIQPGWLLLSCDGRPPGDVLGEDRLHENQVVQCTFRDRRDHERTIALTARTVSTQPILATTIREDGIVVLRFDQFDRESARWLRDQLKTHADAPGLIIDLRQNPGGDAAALGRMLGEFFTHRVDMGTFVSRRGFSDRLHAWHWFASASYTGPVAILVSRNSASSAEIFAAVMQYHHRATTFGETTAGAVLASRFFPLPGGGRLQMAIDDYISPGGRRLEGNGVTPDHLITQTAADLRAGRDPVLTAAVGALHAEAPSPPHQPAHPRA